MDHYTEILNRMSDELFPDDDRYEEQLLAIAATFRSFGEAFTDFICHHGYTGSADDVAAKVKFVKEKAKNAGIPTLRNLKKWFTEGTNITRNSDVPFQICFAFELDVDETNDFFRRVCFERGFDCHNISEAVYYYCIYNGFSYSEAQEIIAQMPKAKTTEIKTDREILYTGTIIDFIRGVKHKDELIAYVREHIDQFGYNNVTATNRIQKLWRDLACDDGLAYKEGQLFDQAFNVHRQKDTKKKDPGREDLYTIVSKEEDSVWNILAQIVGLDQKQTTQLGINRSIKPLLENNVLLPSLAEDCFPDRQGIELIIKGKHVSYERIRKTMILLEFYTYWATAAVKHNNALWEATEIDAERCLDKINQYLIEAGYPELYPGNPYDWIFMWAVKDACPLVTFREYMLALYAHKSSEQAEP